uniref:Copper-containing nitrite reductase n=1 Tax=Methylomonas sp. 16a TaxID=318114 RepID=D2WA19_9GAMM|nr:NirK [Methylomonas sp. 16a]
MDTRHKLNSIDWHLMALIGTLTMALVGCQSQPLVAPTTAEIIGELAIGMNDMSYTPNAIDLAREGRYRVKVHNASNTLHDIVFDNGVAMKAKPGETVETMLDISSNGLSYYCSLPGHEAAGMHGVITVNDQEPVSLRKHLHKPETHIEPVYMSPIAPELLPGKVHDIELIAQEKDMAVAKGAVQNLWTYNGQVPGPAIHVKVGDTVRVHLINPATNKLPHSVDFHASQVAWNDEMASINPGEDKYYDWRADYAGVWMYHCGSNPALHHIASGMYGMVIVEPKEGLAPVDHELAIVQSEFYMGEHGRETNYHKAASGHPSPDFMVFNGVAMQYKDQPIQVETGKKVRIYVLNAGPNEDSAFHIVGTIFNRVIKEGIELSPNNIGHWGSQAVDLAPSQGAIVEFTTAEDGLYPIVTHAFNFVGKGALGLIKAGDGDPKN